MRKTDKPNDTVVVAQQVVHGDGASTVPEVFAGMYQTGYSDGYTAGQGAGFRQGFEEGYAAAHKGPNGAAVMSAAEAAPAPKRGLQRMLLGLPLRQLRRLFRPRRDSLPGVQTSPEASCSAVILRALYGS
jgi:hypothetical protein